MKIDLFTINNIKLYQMGFWGFALNYNLYFFAKIDYFIMLEF